MIDCKLHMLLAEKRMTQKELAEATGIGQNSISRYTNNTWVKFDKDHLDKLCKYFKCTIEDIITFKEDLDFVNETIDEALEYFKETKQSNNKELIKNSKKISNMLQDLQEMLSDVAVANVKIDVKTPKKTK